MSVPALLKLLHDATNQTITIVSNSAMHFVVFFTLCCFVGYHFPVFSTRGALETLQFVERITNRIAIERGLKRLGIEKEPHGSNTIQYVNVGRLGLNEVLLKDI
jgi:hypothetical protein